MKAKDSQLKDMERELIELQGIHARVCERNKKLEHALELAVLRYCIQSYGWEIIERLLPSSKHALMHEGLATAIDATADDYNDLWYLNGLAKVAALWKKEKND